MSELNEEGATPPGWLQPNDWELVQRSVPILAVDIVLFRQRADETPQVALILRESPFAAPVWCHIGGRIRYGESVREAALRHLHGTVHGVEASFDDDPQPDYVMQWFPWDSRKGGSGAHFGYDPRQHAVSLCYRLEVAGEVTAVRGGEALALDWFPLRGLAVSPTPMWPGTLHMVSRLMAPVARP